VAGTHRIPGSEAPDLLMDGPVSCSGISLTDLGALAALAALRLLRNRNRLRSSARLARTAAVLQPLSTYSRDTTLAGDGTQSKRCICLLTGTEVYDAATMIDAESISFDADRVSARTEPLHDTGCVESRVYTIHVDVGPNPARSHAHRHRRPDREVVDQRETTTGFDHDFPDPGLAHRVGDAHLMQPG
jgi:hypothetical protein